MYKLCFDFRLANIFVNYIMRLYSKDRIICHKDRNKYNIFLVLVLSDNAVLNADIKNASCVVHFDYPQKKSHFGNRLSCLLNSIRENVSIAVLRSYALWRKDI